MDVYEALYTTRAMRKVTSEPIPLEAQARIIDAAIRAPSGGNAQSWRFLLLDDPATIARLAPLYRDGMDQLWGTVYGPALDAAAANPDAPSSVQLVRTRASAMWLAEHFEEVPLYLFAFSRNDPIGGSIFPSVWSAMLAARAEGIGTCLTYVLSLFHADETFDVLGVPRDKGWQLSACVSLGYPTGRWAVAPRRPAHEVACRNRWDQAAGFVADEPLWPPA